MVYNVYNQCNRNHEEGQTPPRRISNFVTMPAHHSCTQKKRITGVSLLASDSPLGQQSKEERIFYDLDDEGIIIRGVAVLQKFHEFFFSDGGPGHVKQMFILFHQALG